MAVKELVRAPLRWVGRDVTRWPHPESLGYHLSLVFARHRINLVLDVGANVGQFGRVLRSSGYRGVIVSFEPGGIAFARLEEASGRDPLWFVRKEALGSVNTEAKLNVLVNDACSSLLTPLERERWEVLHGWDAAPEFKVDHVETVPVRRLDDIFHELETLVGNEPRCFLKMDTQGYDLEVFRGAAGCLPNIVALQSELSIQPLYEGMPGMWDALATYREAGYVESGLFAVTLDERVSAVEFDCVMVLAED